MKKQKKNIELWANNCKEALELKKALEEKGFSVNHIYTGSSTPLLIQKNKEGSIRNYTTGLGNIRMNYKLF